MLQRARNTRRNRGSSFESHREWLIVKSRFTNYLGEGCRAASTAVIVPWIIRQGMPDWRILIVFHIDARRLPPYPSTSLSRLSADCTALPRRRSDVARCSSTIIGIINAGRKNPMCARAKRVTRLQKRSERASRWDTNAALIGCGEWESALFREVVDLFPLFLVRRRNRVHRVYRGNVIYDEHCARTFIWFHKSFLRETSSLIGVYLHTAKKIPSLDMSDLKLR